MPLQYEAFVKCPRTGAYVSTGHVVAGPTFAAAERPSGVFDCPSCKARHAWHHEQALIYTTLTERPRAMGVVRLGQ